MRLGNSKFIIFVYRSLIYAEKLFDCDICLLTVLFHLAERELLVGFKLFYRASLEKFMVDLLRFLIYIDLLESFLIIKIQFMCCSPFGLQKSTFGFGLLVSR